MPLGCNSRRISLLHHRKALQPDQNVSTRDELCGKLFEAGIFQYIPAVLQAKASIQANQRLHSLEMWEIHLEHALVAGLPHYPGFHQFLVSAQLGFAALLVPGRFGACSHTQFSLALLQMQRQPSSSDPHVSSITMVHWHLGGHISGPWLRSASESGPEALQVRRNLHCKKSIHIFVPVLSCKGRVQMEDPCACEVSSAHAMQSFSSRRP